MKKKLLIRAPFYCISGYGNYARTILKVLARYDKHIDIRLETVNWGQKRVLLSLDEEIFLKEYENKPQFKEEELKDVYFLMIHLPTGEQMPYKTSEFKKYKKRICMTMFETDNILDSWVVDIHKHLDLLLVPTKFNVETFSKKIKKVPIIDFMFTKNELKLQHNDKIPNAPKNKIYFKEKGIYLNYKETPIKFYHNCNYGVRKGPIETVRAYLNAFKDNKPLILDTAKNKELLNKNVNNFTELELDYEMPENFKKPTQLWLKWYLDYSNIEQEKTYFIKILSELRDETKNFHSEIFLIHENLMYNQLHAIVNSIDVYVMPAYGEGLNLPAVEAIIAKKPVILSECSAHKYILSEVQKPFEIPHYWIKGEYGRVHNTQDPFYAPQAHAENHNFFYPNEKSLEQQYIRVYNDLLNNENSLKRTCEENLKFLLKTSNPNILVKRFYEEVLN
jgi:hypothetical protein